MKLSVTGVRLLLHLYVESVKNISLSVIRQKVLKQIVDSGECTDKMSLSHLTG